MNKILKHDKVTLQIKEEKPSKVLKIKYQDNWEVLVTDSELTKKLIAQKFNKKYKRLLAYCLQLEEDGANDPNFVLTEIDKFALYLEKKYHEHLTKSELSKYLKMLSLLKTEVLTHTIELEQEKSAVR